MDAISTLPVNVQELPTIDTVITQEDNDNLSTFALTMDEAIVALIPDEPIMLEESVDIKQEAVNTELQNTTSEDDSVALEAKDETSEIETDTEQALTLAWFTMPSFEPPAKPIETVIASEQTAATQAAIFLSTKENKADKLSPPVLENKADNLSSTALENQDEPSSNLIHLPTPFLPVNDKDVNDATIGSTDTSTEPSIASHISITSDSKDITDMMPSQIPVDVTLKQFSIPTSGTNIASALEHLSIPTSVDDSEWPNQFNQQIMWMGKQNIDTAMIKIHPEELGPIEISIKMLNDDATITINAQHLPVRDLIEQAMPRLKDMMAEQGINLANVNVESNHKDNNGQAATENERIISQSDQGLSADGMIKTMTRRKLEGVVDYFA